MIISDVIEQLERIKEQEGDIQCSCTHSLLREDPPGTPGADVYETTVETLIVHDHPNIGRAVRFWN